MEQCNKSHKHNLDEKSFTTKEFYLHNRTQEKIQWLKMHTYLLKL